MTFKILFTISCLLGLTSVGLGAYFAHGLHLEDPKYISMLDKALSYHQLYAVLLIALCLALKAGLFTPVSTLFGLTIAVLMLGVMIFSFSIYGGVLMNNASFFKITPIGGTSLMIGWALLIYCGLSSVIKI